MRFMSISLLLITLFSFLPIGLLKAEDQTAAPAPALEASAAKLDPLTASTAKEMMAITNTGNGIRDLIPGVSRSFATIIDRDNPGKAELINQIIENTFTPGFMAHADEFEQQLTAIFASNLSVADMQGIIAFYKTPAGQNYLKVLPILAKQNEDLAHTWAVKVSKEVAPKLFDELRKNNLSIPKEMGG